MSRVDLLVLADSGEPTRRTLPLDAVGSRCEVRLRCLPGASGIHLALEVDGTLRRRAEIVARSGDVVTLEVELLAGGVLDLASESGPLLDLPPDDRFGPAPVFRPASVERGLDLAIVVDGTMRSFDSGEQAAAAPRSKPLLEIAAQREALAERLIGFVAALGADSLRGSVMAFGDEPLDDATAADLRPLYHLDPARGDERALRPMGSEDLRDALTRLRPTPGADLVDALADALAACLELGWRPDARKLVLVVGDSPGHSLLEPAPWGCDARARRCDVDIEASRLGGRGIEIVTIYSAPPRQAVDYFDPSLRLIFQHAREQYQRLASTPEFAFELGELEPQGAAATVAAWTDWLARGAAWGDPVATDFFDQKEAS